ncbi:redox protein [Marinobacterium nitratireducens]|uniref:Redox protein n=1 Tax=Marinobacterium nitratireducens TaxID=518897 RepID=A0A918DSJ2_9GAMM|nr:OsmC family protein [Marinobacterium nitratireducens]GGO81761.1 redox protein [Marinobacterium nitratireducens]
MSVHEAEINWCRQPHTSDSRTYSRNHVVTLSGNQKVDVSASVDFKGDSHCADPEQMLVSAVSSCHMLFFLAIAEFQGFCVESYQDNPQGFLEKSSKGGMEVTRVILTPKIVFGGDKIPDQAAISKIHDSAHKNCFIRNSITATVEINHS